MILTLAVVVVLFAALIAALVVLSMVTCATTDPREVRFMVRAVLAILLMMGALVMVFTHPTGCSL